MTSQAMQRRMKGTGEAARHRLAAVAAEYVESLGRGIRARREALGLSRAEVARKMPGKTNENAVYRWENGQHRPNDGALEALATVLELTTWTKFLELDPERAEQPANGTPSPFREEDQVARRFDALERRVVGQLDEHAREVKAQLTDQTETLEEMRETLKAIRDEQATLRALIAAEQRTTREAQEATARLLGAVDVASQALRGGAQRAEAEPAQ